MTIGTSEADAGDRTDWDATNKKQGSTENEILAEFNREMGALEADEEEPIELTEVVGDLNKGTESEWPQEAEVPTFHSAVNG